MIVKGELHLLFTNSDLTDYIDNNDIVNIIRKFINGEIDLVIKTVNDVYETDDPINIDIKECYEYYKYVYPITNHAADNLKIIKDSLEVKNEIENMASNQAKVSTPKEYKWRWMMGYCKEKGLPPAQKWAWDKAEKAFNEEIKGE